jgi:nickel superoxide dismutase
MYISMMKQLFSIIAKVLPATTAYAHCDVPCGIYDPKPAQIAAATVLKMVDILESIDQSNKSLDDRNKLIRAIWTKEEHARKCKEELLILWTDYFKPEHLSKFPGLHDTFWKAAKLCSENKQRVSKDSAEALVKAVDEIAEMFYQTKAPK